MNLKYNWILDFKIKNYIGCGVYNESVIRSIYATDYIIKNNEIEVIATEFTEEEFKEKIETLKSKAKLAYDIRHKYPLDEFMGYRKVKPDNSKPLFDEGLKNE